MSKKPKKKIQKGSAITSPFAGIHAVVKAEEEGDRGPIAARIRNPAVTLSMLEREYIADVIDPRRRGPRTSGAKKIRAPGKSLEVARTVIRESKGHRLIKNATIDAAKKHECSVSTVKKHLQVARRFWDGDWWRANCRLARKGKGHKLL